MDSYDHIYDPNLQAARLHQEIDNRGSHYWLARYWAEELAKQDHVFVLFFFATHQFGCGLNMIEKNIIYVH